MDELVELSKIINIKIINSNMEVLLSIESNEEINPLLNSELKRLLEEKKVVYGINEKLLDDISHQPEKYKSKSIIIATGLEPKKGKDGYIQWEIEFSEEKKPTQLDDGKVDYYSLTNITNVKKGQLLATRISATDGVPGINVLGDEILGKRGKEFVIRSGKNILLNETKDKIYSAIDGQLKLTDGKINVFPIYEVTGDLDLSIGNIDFVGTVVIRGNIPDGFKIKADGDIKVYGNVDAATLIAGGDINIQQGVIGHNKVYIKANKSFKANFILDGIVVAKEDVIVSQSIMHSNVSAGSKVICQGSKGLIVGGKIQAGELVSANNIGNEMTSPTLIEVGINPELRKELNSLLKEKNNLSEKLDKVNKGLNVLDNILKVTGNLSEDKKRVNVNLMNQRITIDRELSRIKKREIEIENMLIDFNNAKIVITRSIYPGSKLVIGKYTKIIDKEYKYMKFIIDDGDIVAKPI